ncbi:uncharacterized protein LOC130712576 [Lotus japonicus]|uniref:uncharacterized protein LOC130712576 n=1 Tax=Lotus japonicus TaxID=34305 RepID=UPI00258F5383|nr:uncharacterized protein LOC130712576 [Lotus japonicus]
MMTTKQKGVYDNIMQSVLSDSVKIFFLYGYGGTGKTFVWNTLFAAIRSMGMIVLNVASSGIASLLYPGCRTAYSRFCIPLQTDETTTCNIKQGSLRANLLIRAKLIIWDEAPMLNKIFFEALDRTLRDIMRQEDESNMDKPFGAKVVVLDGDFRQILPVIPKGGKQDIVSATINSSDLWKHCKVLKLTRNTRLSTSGNTTKYLSSDNTCKSDEDTKLQSEWFTTEFLNDITCSGIPNHKITLKEGAPIMLLRNIDQAVGLCNGTRLIVADLGTNVIKASVII